MLPLIPSETIACGLEMGCYFVFAVAAFLRLLLLPRG